MPQQLPRYDPPKQELLEDSHHHHTQHIGKNQVPGADRDACRIDGHGKQSQKKKDRQRVDANDEKVHPRQQPAGEAVPFFLYHIPHAAHFHHPPGKGRCRCLLQKHLYVVVRLRQRKDDYPAKYDKHRQSCDLHSDAEQNRVSYRKIPYPLSHISSHPPVLPTGILSPVQP